MSELSDLNAELRAVKRQNANIDKKFMDLYRALEKIKLSETHQQAVQIAGSILKQTSIDHSATQNTTPAIESPAPAPTPQKRRGPKTSKASLGGFF